MGTISAVAAGIALAPTERRDTRSRSLPIDWEATNAGVNRNPNQKMNVSWCGSPASASATPETWVENNLEKRFALELEPLFLDWNSYNNRRPLLLGAGDLPDVNWDGDPTPVRRNIKQGFVLELPYEVIREHAPTYVKHLNRYAPEAWLFSRFEGKNYGVPTFAASDIYPSVPLWRMDWLRKVGLSAVPDTLDEMYATLYKFRHDDPEGNGSGDTYGMCPDLHWALNFLEIFAAFGILPQDFIVMGGGVVWGGVLPQAREALALLRQWYREELIDPDFAIATAGNSPMDRKFTNGRIGYMYAWLGFGDIDLKNPNSRYSTMRALNPAVELVPGKPLRGRDGKRRARVWGGPAHVLWFSNATARQPEKIIRVLQMMETIARDPELFVESRLGKRGMHWDWSPERGTYFLPPYDKRGEDGRNLLTTDIEGAYGFYSPCAIPSEFTDPLLPAGMTDFRKTYSDPAWGMKNAIGKSDAVASAGRYLEDLHRLQTESFVRIIRGDVPLEHFDTFVRTWRNEGGDILTAEAKAMRQELSSIYQQVGIERSHL